MKQEEERKARFFVENEGAVWSSATKRARLNFVSLLYKTNRFHVAVRLLSNILQKTSKCGKNISDTFSFLPHFDVICDLLLNRLTATWNVFVNFTITWKKYGRNWLYFSLRKPRVTSDVIFIVCILIDYSYEPISAREF